MQQLKHHPDATGALAHLVPAVLKTMKTRKKHFLLDEHKADAPPRQPRITIDPENPVPPQPLIIIDPKNPVPETVVDMVDSLQ